MCQIPHPPKPFATMVRELSSPDWKQQQGPQEHRAFLTVVPSIHGHLVANGPHQILTCKVPQLLGCRLECRKHGFPGSSALR